MLTHLPEGRGTERRILRGKSQEEERIITERGEEGKRRGDIVGGCEGWTRRF